MAMGTRAARMQPTRRWRTGRRPGALVRLAALVGVAGLALSIPGVAGATTVTLVSSAQPFFNVVDTGTNVWASTDVACGSADNYVYEFGESGQYVSAYDVGAATCDAPLVASNGSDVAVLNGSTLYVIDPATGTVTSTPLSGMTLNDGLNVTFDGGALVVVSDSTTSTVAAYPLAALLAGTSPGPTWTFVNSGVCSQTAALASVNGDVYVACDFPYDLFELNGSGQYLAQAALANRPGPMGIDGTTAWILSLSGTSLDGYALSNLTGVGSVTLASAASGLYLDGATAWVAQSSASQVSEINLATLSVTGSVPIPTSGNGGAIRVAGSGSNVWVADDNGSLYGFLTVQPSSTSLSVAGGATTDVYGTALQLTATVSTPGTVTFYDDGATIVGCAAVAASTSATCAWTPGSTGPHTLSDALIPTSSSYSTSTSSSNPVVQVAPAASTTTLTLGAGVTRVTASTTTSLTATVSTPGTVTFYDDGATIAGCVAVAASTSATCAWTPSSAGLHSLAANLTPTNPGFSGSSGLDAVTVGAVVLPSSVRVAAAGGATTDVYGTALQLTATVSTPGTVTFYDDGATIAGCAAVAASTSATCAWTPLSIGAQMVTADLAPTSAGFAGSRSTPVAVGVTPATSSVTVAARDVGFALVRGARVTLTATASVAGTVSFVARGRALPGCVGVPVTATVPARCSWLPSRAGVVAIIAQLSPASPDYAAAASSVRATVVLAQDTRIVGPFVGATTALSRRGSLTVESVAALVARDGYRVVTVVGDGGPLGAVGVSRQRADVVRALLSHDLAVRGIHGVRIVVAASGERGEDVAVVVDY